jgi:hypothetical protein
MDKVLLLGKVLLLLRHSFYCLNCNACIYFKCMHIMKGNSLAETAIQIHFQVAMLEFPSSTQIFARFPVELPERLKKSRHPSVIVVLLLGNLTI